MRFYQFYYSSRSTAKINFSILNLIKSLRNASAHNNCILADLSQGSSQPPKQISYTIAQIPSINKNQRRKKLSCRPMLEFVSLIYVYHLIVSDHIKYHRSKELKALFFNRMLEKNTFFKKMS